MAIVPMADAVSGGVALSAEYNKVIDNVLDLDTRLGQPDGNSAGNRIGNLETLTTNTITNGGHGNVRLSDRLGTGVGTGSNVTTGSATSQLTDVRSRLTVVEGLVSGAGPLAQLRQTVVQNFTSASETPVTFTTEDVDTHNGHSTSTNTSRWTCPVGWAGWYLCSGQVFWDTVTTTGSRLAGWFKNGATIPGGWGAPLPGTTGQSGAARTMLIYLAEGDYLELTGRQATGATTPSSITTNQQSTMTLEWKRA